MEGVPNLLRAGGGDGERGASGGGGREPRKLHHVILSNHCPLITFGTLPRLHSSLRKQNGHCMK